MGSGGQQGKHLRLTHINLNENLEGNIGDYQAPAQFKVKVCIILLFKALIKHKSLINYEYNIESLIKKLIFHIVVSILKTSRLQVFMAVFNALHKLNWADGEQG